jgi:hypothetical protein
MEWDDFRFLANTKLGHDMWEAYCNNAWWNGEVFNGCIVRPRNGQEIHVVPHWKNPQGKREEEAFTRKKTGLQVTRSFNDSEDWAPKYDNAEEWDLCFRPADEDPSIIIDYPDNNEKLILQLPRGNEWAYFESFMNSLWGNK